MKKQLMLLWMSLYPVILLAQISAVSQETLSNSEINPASTHQILFELRSDLPMELPGSRAKFAPAELFNHDFLSILTLLGRTMKWLIIIQPCIIH